MQIFYDLDGTLLNSKNRLFNLFTDLTNQTTLSFEDYWDLKKSMHNHEWILKNMLKYDIQDIEQFVKIWMTKIENHQYLAYDKLFPFSKDVLLKNKEKKIRQILVTARQSIDNTIEQLKQLGIYPLIDKILVASPPHSKEETIKANINNINQDDIFIGDTGMDIKTAKDLNIKSVAVLSGFRNREQLEKYMPDFIIEDISKLHLTNLIH